MSRRLISLILSFGLLFQQAGFAQVAVELNLAHRLGVIGNSPAQDKFRPVHLRYFSYDNLSDRFKLLLDKGDAPDLSATKTKETTKNLLNYFLIGIALPDSMFWVNLRPDSADQIIDPYLEKTEVGKIMLEADLQLKKDTASFTSPQTSIGKKYWNKLYQKSAELYGQQNVSIPTLTRPWIVPGEIIVRESAGSAYVYKANLKVMLEQDHLKGSTTYNFEDARAKALNEYSSQLMRELIIPQLTKEVNSAKRYASLRQVYYSLILARWFKLRFAGKSGTYSELINSKNITNLTSSQAWNKSSYFAQYQKSFAEGEYNLQEPVYTPTGQVIRSYFSGGIAVQGIKTDAFTTTTGKDEVPVDFEAAAQIGNIDLETSFSSATPEAAQAAVDELNNHRGLSKNDFKVEIEDEKLGIVVRPKEQNTVAKRDRMMLNNLFENPQDKVQKKYGVLIGELDPAINDGRVVNAKPGSKAGLVNVLTQIIDALGPAEGLDQRVDLSKIGPDTVNSDAASFVIEGKKLGVIKISGLGVSGQETLEVDLKRLRQEGVLIINLDQFIDGGSLVNQPELVDLLLELLKRKINLSIVTVKNNTKAVRSIGLPLKNAINYSVTQALMGENKVALYPTLDFNQKRGDLFKVEDRFMIYTNAGTFRINFNYDFTPRLFGSLAEEVSPQDQEIMEEQLLKLGAKISNHNDSNLLRFELSTKDEALDSAEDVIYTWLLKQNPPNIKDLNVEDKEQLLNAAKLIAEQGNQIQIKNIIILIVGLLKVDAELEWIYPSKNYAAEKDHDILTPEEYLESKQLITAEMRNTDFALELLQLIGETVAVKTNLEIDRDNRRGKNPNAKKIATDNNPVVSVLTDLFGFAPAANMAWLRYRLLKAQKNILKHGLDAIKPVPVVQQENSSPTVDKNAESAISDLGGIDFRVLQMSIQPMGSFRGLEFKMPQLSAAELSKININLEMQQIKNMVKSGMMPSGQRVKELVAACLQKGQLNFQADSLLLCLADIFKLEEENAQETSPQLREALVIVDAQS